MRRRATALLVATALVVLVAEGREPRPARAAAGSGGWVLDAFGGLHPFGGAAPTTPSGYWSGWDITRGADVAPAGGGWVVDGFGGLHPFGGAPAVTPSGYWPGNDLARGITAAPEDGGWVVDGFGGLHAFGGAQAVTASGYWPGHDIARAVAASPAGGGWVVDGFGGLHAFGGAPAVTASGYWPGHDIARGIVANRTGPGGWVVDGFGGLHAFGGAPAVTASGYWLGNDIARAASARKPPPPPEPLPPVRRVITYTVATRGTITADVNAFADHVRATFTDGRGWRGAGVAYRQVASGGHYTVWLAADASVPSFGGKCTTFYSCFSGSNIVINQDRWQNGSPYWPGSLDDYRRMVVNHESGHGLGLGHVGCPGSGALAPIMMQQSKGVGSCRPNPWPLPSERARV